jgi:hypothetical protein
MLYPVELQARQLTETSENRKPIVSSLRAASIKRTAVFYKKLKIRANKQTLSLTYSKIVTKMAIACSCGRRCWKFFNIIYFV